MDFSFNYLIAVKWVIAFTYILVNSNTVWCLTRKTIKSLRRLLWWHDPWLFQTAILNTVRKVSSQLHPTPWLSFKINGMEKCHSHAWFSIWTKNETEIPYTRLWPYLSNRSTLCQHHKCTSIFADRLGSIKIISQYQTGWHRWDKSWYNCFAIITTLFY